MRTGTVHVICQDHNAAWRFTVLTRVNIEHDRSNKVTRRSGQRVNPLLLIHERVKELIKKTSTYSTNLLENPRFKKSGEFDRLRRVLLNKTPQDGTEAFWARVDDIARTRLDAEDKLHLKAADTLHRELLQELDR
jgi:hypothetical protein